jgi:hypothetical protein
MSGRYDPQAPGDWLLEGAPGGFRAQNMRMLDVNADLVASLTTAVLTSMALPLNSGDVVTTLSFKSGATAAGTPVNQFAALYSPAGALLVQSVDGTTTAWAANTVRTFTLATPYQVTAAGVFYAALMVKATTVPTLIGCNVGIAGAAAAIRSSKVLAQTSGSALTDTAPATIATPTTIATIPLVIAE